MKLSPKYRVPLVTVIITSITAMNIASAQAPVDSKHGITFGDGVDHPAMGKSTTTNDLEVDLQEGASVKIFKSNATLPTIKLGEGFSGPLMTDGTTWYRIAEGLSMVDGVFHLKLDHQSGGAPASLSVRVSAITNPQDGEVEMNVTQLGRVGDPIYFPKLRLVNNTSGQYYLDVQGGAGAAASYVIGDNISHGSYASWNAVDWTVVSSIDGSFVSREYDLTGKFLIATESEVLKVTADGSITLGNDPVSSEAAVTIKPDGSVILAKPQGDISMGVYGQ